jgi:hypothetical protein
MDNIKPEYKSSVIIFSIGCILANIFSFFCILLAAVYYGHHNDTVAIFWFIGLGMWLIGMIIMITGILMKANVDRKANRDVCTVVDL